jgi:peptide/nickel transport system substrate-binding protein
MNRITIARLTCAAALLWSAAALAQDLRSVPRDRTLISQGWDFYNQVPSPGNMSPYSGVLLHQRNSLHYTVNEFLFYTDYNANRIIPWQGESWSYNPAFTELTLKLRDGVTWSDGQPFTADDVVFTIDMLKSVAPDVVMSAAIKDTVAKAEALDKLTVKITLTRPAPRWAQDILASGQAARFVVVPKHIWQGQDPRTFTFFDLAKGWPVGTGPYRLVKADSNELIFDRRDHWWAVDTHLVSALPAPERVIYKPAPFEAMPQLFANNDIDIGRALLVGTFEALRARNPALVSWNTSGPVWGAPDGCTFAVAFNTQKTPFDNATVRTAIDAAVDRDQIVELAFEGSVRKAVLPFASYGGVKVYTDKVQDLIDASGVDKRDPKRVEALLTGLKFSKNSDGKWQKPDGSAWPITVVTLQGDPVGPVLAQQLKSVGFDTLIQPLQDGPFYNALDAGNFELAIRTHCGSAYDPWQTLQNYHSRYAAAPGQKQTNPRSPGRYKNPEMDAVLNQMEAKQPSPSDPQYMALVRQAVTLYLHEMPELTLAEELHVVTFNTTYWTGFPSAADPYINPFIPWEGFNLVLQHLKPTK